MTQQVGGVEDPETGQIDAAKLRAVRDHAFREMWFRQEFDALATIRISITTVSMENDRIEWDGVKQKLEHSGRGRNYTANVAVSSVSFAVYDAANRPIYLYYGGLEPLMRREDDQVVPIPAGQFFQDEKRIRKAAQVAVDPI